MVPFVPVVAPMSRRDIENDAIKTILRYYPRLLQKPGAFPVLDFFDHILREDFGLDPGVEPLSDGVEGMTWPDGRVLVNEETYCGADRNIGRPRFTVMHEAYHGMKHRLQIRKALVDTGELVLYRRHEIKPYIDPEWQANTFAAAILMPEGMVRQLMSKTPVSLLMRRITETFCVSQKAAEVRLKKLKA